MIGLLIQLIIIVAIIAICWWVLSLLPVPPIVRTIATVVFALVVVIYLLSMLNGASGLHLPGLSQLSKPPDPLGRLFRAWGLGLDLAARLSIWGEISVAFGYRWAPPRDLGENSGENATAGPITQGIQRLNMSEIKLFAPFGWVSARLLGTIFPIAH